jgi:hypothetical protein
MEIMKPVYANKQKETRIKAGSKEKYEKSWIKGPYAKQCRQAAKTEKKK